jgi:hypothetical protein
MSRSVLDLIAEVTVNGTQFEAEFAHKWGLLPVYMDMSGTLALDADGEVYLLGHDEVGPPERESRTEWRLMALAAAVGEYPDLQHVKPVRPASAVDCASCHGSGRFTIAGLSGYCGACAGMGWHVGGPFSPKI